MLKKWSVQGILPFDYYCREDEKIDQGGLSMACAQINPGASWKKS